MPLGAVVAVERSTSPASIRRVGGRRVVEVSAELAPGVAASTDINRVVEEEILPALCVAHPGLRADAVGMQEEQRGSMVALAQGYVIALLAMFALLAIPFRSYWQPLVIMAVIPFGLVGAILGHLLLGFELSMVSVFGVVALSGVVVNDSLVLIDAINGARRDGLDMREAILAGGSRRLRPVLLTSLTTFFGLLPMIFETSVQAYFLIPLAISLGFGILFATAVVLVLIPVVYASLAALFERGSQP